jgi:hypothetical protein
MDYWMINILMNRKHENILKREPDNQNSKFRIKLFVINNHRIWISM